ncbi:MAG: hypothetical protein IJR08_04685 [Bacilli bacterium]|nr:hypothetical protein [Bacilli bacterium]
MKIRNLFILLTAITLVACSSNTSKVGSSSIEDAPSSSNEATQVTSDSSENESVSSFDDISASSATTSSSVQESSSSSSSNSSSSQETAEETVTFNFFNPSCGTAGSNVLNTTLKNYMNQVAGFTFVSNVSNVNCQIMDTAPEKGYQKLTIRSAKNSGELEFTFASNVKTVKVTAYTYYKYYDNANHPDSPSICYVNSDDNIIDVSAAANNEPIEKSLTVAINSKTVKIYNNAASNRVYIKELTFTY